MLIKGESCPLTYTIFNSQTGLPITGVTNHVITLIATNGTTTVLPATVTDSGNGRYTFTLPAANTNVDTLTIQITSTTANAVVPPIVCRFTEVANLIPEDSDIYDAIDTAVTTLQNSISASESVITTQLTAVDAVIDSMQSDITAMVPKVSAVYTKIDAYPIGNLIVKTTDIPSATTIANEVLTTGCTDALATASDDFSLVSLILSSFYSTLNFTNNTWTIKQPNGLTLLTRHLTTSDTVKSITEIKD